MTASVFEQAAPALPGLPLDRWLQPLDDEYLSDYVPSGGSAVKVITGSDATLAEAVSRLRERAEAHRMFTAHLDPSVRDENGRRPDFHRIEKFFFEVTREVDWKEWAAAQARRYLEAQGIRLLSGRDLGDLEQIAADNGREAQDLVSQYQRELATPQIRDIRLSIEFRTAITALSRALLLPDSITPTTEEVLLGWLRGQALPGAASALKKVQIYERINLSNARPMLASFCRWLPQAGCSGLLVTLDFRPYEYKRMARGRRQAEQLQRMRDAIQRGAPAGELQRLAEADENEPDVTYSDAAYMQMLQTIRRFIDEIDRFERFLLVILTTPAFYRDKTLDPSVKRCYFDYDALQTRIGQEVHDARHANPAASLVRLGTDEADRTDRTAETGGTGGTIGADGGRE